MGSHYPFRKSKSNSQCNKSLPDPVYLDWHLANPPVIRIDIDNVGRLSCEQTTAHEYRASAAEQTLCEVHAAKLSIPLADTKKMQTDKSLPTIHGLTLLLLLSIHNPRTDPFLRVVTARIVRGAFLFPTAKPQAAPHQHET